MPPAGGGKLGWEANNPSNYHGLYHIPLPAGVRMYKFCQPQVPTAAPYRFYVSVESGSGYLYSITGRDKNAPLKAFFDDFSGIRR